MLSDPEVNEPDADLPFQQLLCQHLTKFAVNTSIRYRHLVITHFVQSPLAVRDPSLPVPRPVARMQSH